MPHTQPHTQPGTQPGTRPRLPARSMRRCLAAWLPLAALGLSACATLQAPVARPGQTEADVRAAMGEPTGRYALPDGQQRLEYAKGPYGRTTWMVDLDAAGRVAATRQVLTEATFAQVRNGMTRDELLLLLGRPADKAGEFMNRQTWSWRYPTYDCLWARVTLTAEGRVWGGASFLPDPRCDADM